MLISQNWLQDYVNLDGLDVKDIWNRFTLSTAEVEDITRVGQDIKNVVVGRVEKVQPHPNSEKLTICQLDAGNGLIQTVCGAPNIKEGLLVPFALEGGSIRNLDKVSKTTVQGIESFGIACSPFELGISDSHEGVMVLEGDYAPGTDIKEIIDIDDIIIEIDNKSLTNRPDLWGHYGIARELAAIFKRELAPLEIEEGLENSGLPDMDIRVLDKEKCYRFSGLKIDGIREKNAKINMQTRLYYCGMRPISLLVDLTNYIMLELGQPMHAYDKRLIEGFIVKSPTEAFKFKTLDSIERTIPEDVLMICDQDNNPVGIAGIMGGENTEVRADTEGILLEAANFEGSSLRKNSTRLGLRTEASARFEKMLDPYMTTLSIKRFVKLLKEVQEDIVIASNLTDVVARSYDPVKISVNRNFINKYIGHGISDQQIIETLKSLEFEVVKEGDTFNIDVPSFRATKDVSIGADIIEEISRIYGYDNIMPETIEVPLEPLEYNEARLADHRIRDLLSEKFGMSEVNSYIWYDETFNSSIGIPQRGNVKILNPHAPNLDTLRDSMLPTMLGFADVNRKNFDDFGIFEIGSVFNAENSKSKCKERKSLCILKASKDKNEDRLFYDLKGIADVLLKLIKNEAAEYTAIDEETAYPWLHPIKSADINCSGKKLGYLSVVHPIIKQKLDKKLNIAFIEINLEDLYSLKEAPVMYKEPSKYPGVTLDFNFLADKNVSYEEMTKDIDKFTSDILLGYEFVDIYTGKGLPEAKKSMTFRFNIGSSEKTLSSDEINEFSSKLIKHMEDLGYPLR
jgi:phenylalanyl-tRNA synthetase beta chain